MDSPDRDDKSRFTAPVRAVLERARRRHARLRPARPEDALTCHERHVLARFGAYPLSPSQAAYVAGVPPLAADLRAAAFEDMRRHPDVWKAALAELLADDLEELIQVVVGRTLARRGKGGRGA